MGEIELNGEKKTRAEWAAQAGISVSALNHRIQRGWDLREAVTTGPILSNHGGTSRPEYGVWKEMIRRCHEPTHPNYVNYGGRGITVCERWRGPNGFINFISDMGSRPQSTERITLDRTNNDKGYGPDNCRWVTQRENNLNRRNNVRIEIDGVTKTATEGAEERGLDLDTFLTRMRRGKMAPKDALTSPDLRTTNFVEIDGQTKTIKEWSKISGVPERTIHSRLKRDGRSPKDAVFGAKWQHLGRQ